MIRQENFVTGSVASGATTRPKVGIPQGAVIRRVYVKGSASQQFDCTLTTQNSDTPDAQNKYHESLNVLTELDINSFTNAYVPSPALYLVLRNDGASAQTFTINVVFEEPAASY